MSLLREIQNAALDSSVPLADTLRRCKVLAARLQSDELTQWVGRELSGYANKIGEAPEYRRFKCLSLGNFSGAFGSGLKNAPISLSAIPKKFRHLVETATIGESVAALDAMVSYRSTKTRGIRVPWPPDLIRYVQTSIYENMSLLSADRILSHAQLVGILDTVRTRMLEFALEIEKQDPAAGEASLRGSPPVPPDKVGQILNVTIYGGQQAFGNAATFQIAGRDVVISSAFNPEQQVQLKALLEEMHGHLASVMDESEREDATEALQKVETELAKEQPQPGRLRRWLGTYASVVGAAAGTVKLVEQILEFLK